MKSLYFALCLLFSLHTAYSQDGYIQGEPALAYWEVGEKAETIIVLHGGPSVQHQYLRPEFDALSEVGKIIYYDQRGCGKSKDAESYVWQEHVKDLKRVVRTFSKGKKVILVGSSWGSLLATIYAYSHPEDVKGLILTGTIEWPGKDMDAQGWAEYKAEKLHSVKPGIFKSTMREEQIVPAGSNQTGERTVVVEKDIDWYIGDYKGEARYSLITGPSFDKLQNITVSVLIFYGDKAGCSIEDWGYKYAQVFPLAKVRTIKDVCHDPWLRDPGYFFAESKRFVKNLELYQRK